MRTPSEWAALDLRHLWHPFTQHDEWAEEAMLIVDRAEGVELIDVAGRRYLDGTSSLWCNVHGHRHPRIDAAVRAQLERVAHTTQLGLANTTAIALAARLATLTGFPRVFYSDSGSTAVEVALKMAFQAQQQRGQTQRTRFAALTEAYHGDTIGSVSVGGIPLFHGIYKPMLFDAVRIPAPDRAGEGEAALLAEAEALFHAHGDTIAAFVFEPLVQGAAGMRTHSPAFLEALCHMARDAGALLVADEVATGFGRTGTMFAIDQTAVRPDILCIAKGLTGGYLPLAATLTTEAVFSAFRGPYNEWKTLFHGHTYTGNPLACAAALASLDLFEEDAIVAGLAPRIAALRDALATLTHPAVRETRQIGLMAAIVLSPGPTDVRLAHRVSLACRDEGVVVRSLGDAVVVMPPLVMTPPDLQRIVAAVGAALTRVMGAATGRKEADGAAGGTPR
ncbi:MAG: adenosylmethionine--8-amino-7-oxononanoate transaminase [Pseudomonadota bacterium]|nr:adenosylmethionine--8-amino-7-oxononanoate transaminase [Pseudomonadota bacterium]